MKALKIIVFGILGLIAILLVVSLVAPSDYHVERTVEINAPKEVVMASLTSLKDFDQNWSPYSPMDPDAKYSYEGTDGQIGSSSSWEGEKVGKGKQEIVAITDGRVETKLTFVEPFESEGDCFYQCDQSENNSTKVTWGFDTKAKFPMNAFMLFMNMEDMLGENFDNGLARLKTHAEENAKKQPAFNVQEVEFPGHTYLAKRGEVPFQDISKFYEENLKNIGEAAGKNGLPIAGAPSGLYFKWDEATGIADMAVAMPVIDNKDRNAEGFEKINVPAGKALMIDYYGPYDNMEAAHLAIDDYMEAKGYTQSNVIEEYITDPGSEPDQSKWLTKIYYVLQ